MIDTHRCQIQNRDGKFYLTIPYEAFVDARASYRNVNAKHYPIVLKLTVGGKINHTFTVKEVDKLLNGGEVSFYPNGELFCDPIYFKFVPLGRYQKQTRKTYGYLNIKYPEPEYEIGMEDIYDMYGDN